MILNILILVILTCPAIFFTRSSLAYDPIKLQKNSFMKIDKENISFEKAFAQYQPSSVLENSMTVGFEIEGYIDDQFTRADFAEKLVPYIQEYFGEIKAMNGLPTFMKVELKMGSYFLVDRDDTIDPPPGGTDVEINTPAMLKNNYRSKAIALLEILRKSGFRFTKTSSIHVHVGFPSENVSSGELILLNDIFHVIQKDFFRVFRPHEERLEHYAGPISSAHSKYVLNQKYRGEDLINNPSFGKIEEIADKLPLAAGYGYVDISGSLSEHGTIQLRILNGSFDIGPLEFATEFLAKLILSIHTQNPSLKKYMLSVPPDGIKLQEISRILGVEHLLSHVMVKNCNDDLKSVL